MSTRPVKHRARALARREALLQAAIEIVGERGLAGATHRAIAERAGVPHSTTTYFFSSIDDLLLEALTHFTQQRTEHFAELGRALEAGASSLPEIAYGFAEALLSSSPHEMAQFELYLDAGRPGSRMKRRVAEIIDGFTAVAVAALAAAGARDPERLAPVIVRLADGFALHGIAQGRRPLDPAPLAEAFLLLVEHQGDPA